TAHDSELIGKMIFRKLQTKTRINLLVQCIGMLVGTTTHLMWIVQHGFLSERYNAPVLSRFFWDSLTFLDPVAGVLLMLKPKTGLWLTVLIIVTDVLHNSSICFGILWTENQAFISWMKDNWMLWFQLGFGLFVLLSFKSNLKEIRNKS
uniref:hypothetical protein n=1 Tax=Fluviicola sp. TaxID=1917219 RepID=UPI00260296EF